MKRSKDKEIQELRDQIVALINKQNELTQIVMSHEAVINKLEEKKEPEYFG